MLTLIAAAQLARNSAQVCATFKDAAIYSDARTIEETGDVLGYELAVRGDRSWLFIYEGAPDSDALPMTGSNHAGHVRMSGEMEQTLIEFPGKREIKHVLRASFSGVLKQKFAKLNMRVDDGKPGSEILKRVPSLYFCSTTKNGAKSNE